jgi:hypothetical protein
MKIIQVKLYNPESKDSRYTTNSLKWTPFLRARFDTTILVASSCLGVEYPIRNVIKQIDSSTLEIISEQYTASMLQRLSRLKKDFTFPSYQVKVMERDGWKH